MDFAGLPEVVPRIRPPLPSVQVALPHAFRPLFAPSRHEAFYGGRSSGELHAAAALILMGAERPSRVLAPREIQRSIRGSSKRLRNLLPKL